ncbi:hypothetical protein ACHAWU_006022 [Discostella pseudostelligera]|uniref:Uncharacterized protein n=1 Tax=Discostella pseudostelligera TaxID=259834 RepID=A0ABD3M1V4_9STRA
MAAAMAQKRKPFGAIDGNARVAEKRSAASAAGVDVRKSKSTKARDGESDSTDGFVSASLKRLFPSKTSSKHEQTIKSSRLASAKIAPFVNNSSRNMDPIAKGEVEDEARGVDADEVLDTMQGMFRMNEQQNRTNHPHEIIASSDVQLPKTGRTQPIIPPQRHEKPSGGLDELLDRARKGPTDNKRVLDAMLTSGCGRRTLGPDPTVNESSMESFVGTIIGGTSLKRSTSIDESEVTTMDYTMDSSHASMTTCFDQGLSGRGGVVAPHHTASDNLHSIAGKQIRGAILRSAVPPPSPAKSQVMSWYHEMQRASAITDTRPPTEQNPTGAMPSIFRTAVPPPPTSQVMPSYQENHRFHQLHHRHSSTN